MNRFSLDGKVAVVTGAYQGLGAAIARSLGQAGARVVLVDIRDAAPVAAEIQEATQRDCLGIIADVADEAAIRHMVEVVQQRFGRIDILVNHAGTTVHYPVPTPELDLEQHWLPVIRVNLTGPLICTREVSKVMIKQGTGGSIINTVSTAGMRPSFDGKQQGYYATKAGLINLTRAWALEFARRNIRVNAVAPGMLRTDFTRTWFQDELTIRWLKSKVPLGDLPEPERVTGVYVFLASDASRFITGQTLVVDGGCESALFYEAYSLPAVTECTTDT